MMVMNKPRAISIQWASLAPAVAKHNINKKITKRNFKMFSQVQHNFDPFSPILHGHCEKLTAISQKLEAVDILIINEAIDILNI